MAIRRYALSDDQWQRIEHLLSGRVGTVGVTAKDNRLFFEAVLYRYRFGPLARSARTLWRLSGDSHSSHGLEQAGCLATGL